MPILLLNQEEEELNDDESHLALKNPTQKCNFLSLVCTVLFHSNLER